MADEEKYRKLLNKISGYYDMFWEQCPDASKVEEWAGLEGTEEMQKGLINLGKFMAIEGLVDYLEKELGMEFGFHGEKSYLCSKKS